MKKAPIAGRLPQQALAAILFWYSFGSNQLLIQPVDSGQPSGAYERLLSSAVS
jgi:hypothetical protein